MFVSKRVVLLSETNNLLLLKQVNVQESEALYRQTLDSGDYEKAVCMLFESNNILGEEHVKMLAERCKAMELNEENPILNYLRLRLVYGLKTDTDNDLVFTVLPDSEIEQFPFKKWYQTPHLG